MRVVYKSWNSTVNFANEKWKCIVNFALGNWKKCNGNREGNTKWYQKCIVNFALGNWKKYYGNSEGNTIVISEMHMPIFL